MKTRKLEDLSLTRLVGDLLGQNAVLWAVVALSLWDSGWITHFSEWSTFERVSFVLIFLYMNLSTIKDWGKGK
jgi:ABC-type nickel/cobalt efflux system permease component RcnA